MFDAAVLSIVSTMSAARMEGSTARPNRAAQGAPGLSAESSFADVQEWLRWNLVASASARIAGSPLAPAQSCRRRSRPVLGI